MAYLCITSAPIGAWICTFPPLWKLWQTNQTTDCTAQLMPYRTDGRTKQTVKVASRIKIQPPKIISFPVTGVFCNVFLLIELGASSKTSTFWWYNFVCLKSPYGWVTKLKIIPLIPPKLLDVCTQSLIVFLHVLVFFRQDPEPPCSNLW